MPELPDIEVYCARLRALYSGHTLDRVRLGSPFLLRSVAPPLSAVEGRRVLGFSRLGKRIVWELEGDLFLVLHLMIAGRLHEKKPGTKIPAKVGMAAFDFAHKTLMLTEANTQKRASLHVVQGADGVRDFDPGGLEVLDADLPTFSAALTRKNHTLKRALTDPHILSGIGNAYSDEILWEAQLSPVTWTTRLTEGELRLLFETIHGSLTRWQARLIDEVGDGFPEKVTAFRPEMAVHGKYGQPCLRCGDKVQRIRYANNETNYCATCQNGGKLLADRGLSRLLGKDWPKTLEELEAKKKGG